MILLTVFVVGGGDGDISGGVDVAVMLAAF